MSREWQPYLADIKTASEKVTRFTAGMDRHVTSANPNFSIGIRPNRLLATLQYRG
jgi:uncharacterized protein with HEPN domain